MNVIMFKHYLNVSFRNFFKYKTQSIISVLGLAIGFTAFAMSALWIRYEMSYDDFHPKADRIYRIQIASNKWDTVNADASEITSTSPYPLASYLKEKFPEIEDACNIRPSEMNDDGIIFLTIDSSFCNIFDIPDVPEDFFIRKSIDPVVVTDKYRKIDLLKSKYKYTIQHILPAWPENTNIPFNVLVPVWLWNSEEELNSSNYSLYHTYILLKEGADIRLLEKKLDKIFIGESDRIISLVVTPLRKLHYKNPDGNIKTNMRFNHILIFSGSGLLVILCALFNYLTLYIGHIRIRSRELALRKVNGASNTQIITTLSFDFLLVLILSLITGVIFMALSISDFKEYAMIGSSNMNVFAEIGVYALLMILCGIMISILPVFLFHRKALHNHLKGNTSRSNHIFRKACLLVQLVISFGLIFCSAVFFKQINYLYHVDLGINRHHIATFHIEGVKMDTPYAEKIKQLPGIVDAIPSYPDILNTMTTGKIAITSYMQSDDKSEKENYKTMSYWAIGADPRFLDIFDMEIVEGTNFSNHFPGIVINETAAKTFEGSAVGQEISGDKIVGVVRDFYITPTSQVKPTIIQQPRWEYDILYKYEDGMKEQSEKAIMEWVYKEFPDQEKHDIRFTYMEEVFEKYFESEKSLLILLLIMTVVCILIALFGIFSMTDLSCEQRRKEIAIRKVNGAGIKDILDIFFGEYLLLFFLAAVIAFPSGYFIMKNWQDNYVKQTSIDAWLFVLIFLVVTVVVFFTIISMILKTARENPAEVLKSE
ncbi:MAG: FtsX-like permease family protein [Bacteroidales bacterium]|jgi:ABC-type antimicrobial peptide transport system permease subunit|nr:FtsX-like permease family protein [Bacteroidales bacterium]